MLAQGDDETNAQEGPGDSAKGQQHRVEISPVTQDKNGRHGKHHAAGCAVHGAGNRLRDVVLNDAVTPQDTAEDAEAQDRREFGPFDGEAENKGRITDTDRNDGAEKIPDQDGGPGQFRIRPVADDGR